MPPVVAGVAAEEWFFVGQMPEGRTAAWGADGQREVRAEVQPTAELRTGRALGGFSHPRATLDVEPDDETCGLAGECVLGRHVGTGPVECHGASRHCMKSAKSGRHFPHKPKGFVAGNCVGADF
jgi:hypothetical protein